MTDHRQILVALRQITRAIDLHSKHLTKTVGLTAPQLLVLQALEKTGRAKPSDIARAVHLSQATITSIVDRLARAGLADRERNETDRRVVEVVLTDSGRARLAEAPTLLQEGFIERFDQLEPWEQSQLIAAVQRLASMMNVGKMDAAPILQIGDLQD
ncbi:MAG: MarR family transcriptional regulator [Pseudomonadota bacterium]